MRRKGAGEVRSKGKSRPCVVCEQEGRGTSGEKGERCTRWEGKECGEGDVWGGSKEGVYLKPISGEMEIDVTMDERAR